MNNYFKDGTNKITLTLTHTPQLSRGENKGKNGVQELALIHLSNPLKHK